MSGCANQGSTGAHAISRLITADGVEVVMVWVGGRMDGRTDKCGRALYTASVAIRVTLHMASN